MILFRRQRLKDHWHRGIAIADHGWPVDEDENRRRSTAVAFPDLGKPSDD